MLVLPDLTEEIEAAGEIRARRKRITASSLDWPLALRIFVLVVAVTLFAAAAGLWAQPTVGYPVLVIKLPATAAMFGFGVLLVSMLKDNSNLATVQVDSRCGEIRTLERDQKGQVFLTGRYDLQSMAEISLRNRTLFARDAAGRLAVSVPVRNRWQERALRAALALG